MRPTMPSTLIAAAALVAGLAGTAHAQQVKELTFWSHWAAEMPKRSFVEEAIRQFEAKNPGIKLKQTWYEKTALYAGLKTALRAGQAPDIFYAEPDQVEYMENGFLLDLSDLNWAAVEPWAKEAWSYKGKPYGLPLEAWTVELYYNKKTMAELGVKVPDSLQLSPDAFPRHGQEGQGQGHHADGARRRRPALSRRACRARGAAEEARRRRLRQAAQGQAPLDRPARGRHPEVGAQPDRGRPAAQHVHHPQARRSRTSTSTPTRARSPSSTAAGTPRAPSILPTRAASPRTSRSAS